MIRQTLTSTPNAADTCWLDTRNDTRHAALGQLLRSPCSIEIPRRWVGSSCCYGSKYGLTIGCQRRRERKPRGGETEMKVWKRSLIPEVLEGGLARRTGFEWIGLIHRGPVERKTTVRSARRWEETACLREEGWESPPLRVGLGRERGRA